MRIKIWSKNFIFEATLILQEFSDDEDETLTTWEYLLYNRKSETMMIQNFFQIHTKLCHILLIK